MQTATSRKNSDEGPAGGALARVTYDTAWHLGSATRSVRDGFWGMGRLIRGAPEAVVRCSRALGRRILGGDSRPADGETLPPRAGIRSIIIDERRRRQTGTGGMTLLELEQRLRSMAATVEALQQRMAVLSARGPVSEADVWTEMNALESADALTGDERTLLVGVFRRNMALQKPTSPTEATNQQ
jgi:hypothetical protein